ncbi:hypothetical protein CEXT_300191 [Caerostris extrusa]|uniref:Uncharacterized protein n=1 Tax=Caerostris extrusa TaxID=172846 RepID=A0AAV4TUP4_CAEEX|nr:hypothetical protein CEXT_300191 [Caerostris extrusa]
MFSDGYLSVITAKVSEFNWAVDISAFFRSIPGIVVCRGIFAFSSMYCNLLKGCLLFSAIPYFFPYYGCLVQRSIMGFKTLGVGPVFSPEVVSCSLGSLKNFSIAFS